MKKEDNFKHFLALRDEYKTFTYEGFSILKKTEGLFISFEFNLSDKYFFRPTLTIPAKNIYNSVFADSSQIENIVFHIGMVELISYWKAACSPKIIIKPFYLDQEQINWWKKLYFHGLGEFFYLNSIQTSVRDFVSIETTDTKKLSKQSFMTCDSTIVPIGGGKDSIVTLELLLKQQKNISCFIINKRLASLRTIEKSGCTSDHIIEFHRTIDPELLKLNEKGFLNGHTPFSALLAFNTLLAGAITGKKNIALSNESSANEPTTEGANHQYSKSFEFENDFRSYVKKFITEDLNYFSFLRPLNELQIAKLFSKQTKYFSVFKSCNAGSKTDEWCGKCPKCLFTYIILSPFIPEQQLQKIFSKNLFADIELQPVFDELIGKADVKPFDCIGTIDEINNALCLTIKQKNLSDLPYLLHYYSQLDIYETYTNTDPTLLLNTFNTEHYLSPALFDLLILALNEK